MTKDLVKLPALLMQWRAAHVMQLEAIDRLLEELRHAPASAQAPQPHTQCVPQAPPRKPGGRLTSPERDAIIVRDWPLGVPVSEVARRVNALPGGELSNARIGIRANELGVKRPAGFTGQGKGTSAVKARPIAATPGAASLSPVEIDDASIVQWATERGLTGKMTLSVINAARMELGLPPFARGDRHLLNGQHAP